MKRAKAAAPKRLEIDRAELAAILARAAAALSAEDHAKLEAAIETLDWLTGELGRKDASLHRLRQWLFGTQTEKTRNVVGPNGGQGGDGGPGADAGAPNVSGDGTPAAAPDGEKTKRPGHGRNGTSAYTGADRVKVKHPAVAHGDRCPACARGKVYAQKDPKVLVRIRGMAPIVATVYELERLRCNLCGEGFKAEAPPGVGEEKYDETASSMVAVLKYGAGMPFHRLAKLERALGIPLPASTQWQLVEEAAAKIEPVFEELVTQAAQGIVLYNDDTAGRVLELTALRKAAEEGERADEGRTGVFTSGIVSVGGEHTIALFLTGGQHAGENLGDVLARRRADLGPPIQMCDALSRNVPDEAFATIVGNCNAHARRKFVDVATSFPAECRRVLETFGEVYGTDARARKEALDAEARLRLHQAESAPRLAALREWMKAELAERRVEPHSGLGDAFGYLDRHWDKLTLFLRVPGVPLDSNVVERALKKAILHRKNALFYKTQNGARVGDLFMSLIHTAELEGVNPFDYLVALQRHHVAVADDPGAWMPWNYTEALARLAAPPASPP